MMKTINELRETVAPVATKYALRAVYLFGSYARNEADSDSDIDVLVDITDSKVKGWIIGGLYNDLCKAFEQSIDIITTDTLQQATDSGLDFEVNVMKDRVLIYEQH